MRWVIAIPVLALALTGCEGGSPDADLASGPVAVFDWTADGAEQALLEGSLTLVDGCLYVAGPDDALTLPVFPSAYVAWDADAQTLTYNGETYGLGDAIWAGGGWHEPGESAIIPASCKLDSFGQAMFVQATTLKSPSG